MLLTHATFLLTDIHSPEKLPEHAYLYGIEHGRYSGRTGRRASSVDDSTDRTVCAAALVPLTLTDGDVPAHE